MSGQADEKTHEMSDRQDCHVPTLRGAGVSSSDVFRADNNILAKGMEMNIPGHLRRTGRSLTQWRPKHVMITAEQAKFQGGIQRSSFLSLLYSKLREVQKHKK